MITLVISQLELHPIHNIREKSRLVDIVDVICPGIEPPTKDILFAGNILKIHKKLLRNVFLLAVHAVAEFNIPAQVRFVTLAEGLIFEQHFRRVTMHQEIFGADHAIDASSIKLLEELRSGGNDIQPDPGRNRGKARHERRNQNRYDVVRRRNAESPRRGRRCAASRAAWR